MLEVCIFLSGCVVPEIEKIWYWWVGLGWVSQSVGWVQILKFFVGWVGSVSRWVGLGWVGKNGPTDNSDRFRRFVQ